MATTTTIEERTISGIGRIKIPNDKKNQRQFTLYANVIRMPKSPYKSFEISPQESIYARMTFLQSKYVLSRDYMRFESQKWVFTPDIAGQTLIAVKCAYDGILQTFVNLGLALNLTPISVINSIKDYKQFGMDFDEIRFTCYKGTAIKLTLLATDYDACKEDYKEVIPPPDPPAIPPQVPPGTPITVSLPYDDENNDPITEPFEDDEIDVPPPVGLDCVNYNVLLEWEDRFNQTVQEVKVFLGPIGQVRTVTGQYSEAISIEIEARGQGFSTCGLFRYVRFTGAGGLPAEFNNPRIVAFGAV